MPSRQELALNGELLLLCERTEMARFLHAYWQHLLRQGAALPSAQLLNYCGLDRLGALARRLPSLPGSGKVRRAVIFADAADDLEKRRNVTDAVRSSAYFLQLEQCDCFFFPGRQQGKRWRRGYLEDALLASLLPETAESSSFQNLLNVGREYLLSVDCCRGREHRLNNSSRHLLYAYFAGTEKYAGLDLGAAARRGAFDLDGAAFDCLKQCLLAEGRTKAVRGE